MAPNMKGFALFTRAINDDVFLLAQDKYWYVLIITICRGRPGQLFKEIQLFPDEFRTEEAQFGWPIMETVVTVRLTLINTSKSRLRQLLCWPFC